MADQTYPVTGGPGFVLNPAADFPAPPHPDRLPFMPIDPTDPNRAILELSNPNEPGTPAAEAVQRSAESYAELEMNTATDETNLVGAGTLSASGQDQDPMGYAGWGLRGGEFNPPGAMDFDEVKATMREAAVEAAQVQRDTAQAAFSERAAASKSSRSARATRSTNAAEPMATVAQTEDGKPVRVSRTQVPKED